MPYYNNFGNGYPSYSPMGNAPVAYGQIPTYTGVQSYDQSQQDTTVSWVQGRSGAEAYPLAPGRRAMLMDSNEPILYVKATDASGRYMPLQSYRLVPMEEVSQAQALPQEAIDYDRIREIIAEEVNKKMNFKKEGK